MCSRRELDQMPPFRTPTKGALATMGATTTSFRRGQHALNPTRSQCEAARVTARSLPATRTFKPQGVRKSARSRCAANEHTWPLSASGLSPKLLSRGGKKHNPPFSWTKRTNPPDYFHLQLNGRGCAGSPPIHVLPAYEHPYAANSSVPFSSSKPEVLLRTLRGDKQRAGIF